MMKRLVCGFVGHPGWFIVIPKYHVGSKLVACERCHQTKEVRRLR